MGSDLSVVNAARASFRKESTQLSRADLRLLDYLAAHGHHSPFRHAMLAFEIEAPLMVARQWFKYRVGSAHTPDTVEWLGVPIPEELTNWRGQGDDGGDGQGDLLQARNEASRRYVTLPPAWYQPAPSEWRAAPNDRKQGSGEPVSPQIGERASVLLDEVIRQGEAAYNELLAAGVCAEQARLCLPAYALRTAWRWVASLDAVAHFLRQRLHGDAQSEIRRYAAAVHDLASAQFPRALAARMSA